MSEARALQEEIDRLRAGLQAILEGDVPRPRGKAWFGSGQISKHDECIHAVFMWDDCSACLANHVKGVIEGNLTCSLWKPSTRS